MFGFLLSRRWVLFGLFVAVLGVACWRLGVWQFDRLQERRVDNGIIEANLAAEPAPAVAVMSASRPLSEADQWRSVRLTGSYDVSNQVIVRYQTRAGQPGANVVAPLRLDRGQVALVDRGWLPVSNDPSAAVRVPAPPGGQVTVAGWALPNQSGDPDEITPANGQVRLISSAGFEQQINAPLLRGYVSARVEEPAPGTPLVSAEPPELNAGPHFFYGLQWWFFAALAVGGFGYFAWVEARERRASR